MKSIIKNKIFLVLIIISIVSNTFTSFSATAAGQELRTQTLYLADIIENDNAMNDFITRGEFARMIVKASPYKDSASIYDSNTGFTDVSLEYAYAPFVKIASKEGYIVSYLGGLFKPLEYVTYRDLIRACLALLGYTNDDFTGNQISGRLEMFTSLKMNDNIDKSINDYVTKKDAVNAVYNTLKTNKKGGNSAYGPTVFTNLSVNSDGDLNATGLTKTKLNGPYILKRGEALNLSIPFDITTANIFINGTSANLETLYRELNNQGYLIYYYNETTKTIYIYKEGTTLESSTMVKKGYVNHIYYNAGDTVTPTRVEIDLSNYTLGSSEVQFAFSYAGTISVGDQIIFIYTKSDTSSDEDTSGEGTVVTEGTITHAYIYDLRY
ncbi:MAG: S-layer homology domain-containing protein [Lachnospiraceae bacterium]|nr:S-layer homology domain-containing protein [Lachnospiraceae bacterium]